MTDQHHEFSFSPQCDYVFRWPYGGEDVKLAGTFSRWEPVSTTKSEDGTFMVRMRLPAQALTYKWIVDGRWCYDVTKPTVRDFEGNVNNSLDCLFVAVIPFTAPLTAGAWLSSPAKDRLAFSLASPSPECTYPWHGYWSLAFHTAPDTEWHGRWRGSFGYPSSGAQQPTLDIAVVTDGVRTSSGADNTQQSGGGILPIGAASIRLDHSGGAQVVTNNGIRFFPAPSRC